jgi:hypothetical protein
MRLFYLTALHHGLANIALRRVKISRFSDLNDPFELLAIDLKDRRHRQAFRGTKEKLNDTKGLICLSKTWENPLLWGHYAEKHTGIALGFDVDDHLLSEVIYARSPETIPIDPTTDRPVLSEKLVNRLLRTKFHDWKYEQEMRVFVELHHETHESGMYFYDFSADFQLREVILGPRCEVPIKGVRAMVSGYSPDVSVIKARIAFSSFRVVKDKLTSS